MFVYYIANYLVLLFFLILAFFQNFHYFKVSAIWCFEKVFLLRILSDRQKIRILCILLHIRRLTQIFNINLTQRRCCHIYPCLINYFIISKSWENYIVLILSLIYSRISIDYWFGVHVLSTRSWLHWGVASINFRYFCHDLLKFAWFFRPFIWE